MEMSPPGSQRDGKIGASAAAPTISDAERMLRETFGHSAFLPLQGEVIARTLQGEDMLVVLQTGSGKSLCFQIPALLRPGLTIVLSPLIALMKDQIDSLAGRTRSVACLHSALAKADSKRILDDIRARRLKMVYVSPERLRDGFFINALLAGAQVPHLWVVDEAHCITEWGHDFRTDYLFIPDAVELVSTNSQMLMLTATATPLVQQDILGQMRRESASVVCGNFDRPNLYLGCRQTPTKSDKLRTLAELLRRPGPGIIYTATRRQCEDVNRFLQELGKRCDYYHAGRGNAARSEVHERFMSNDVDIVVSTNAFGMGVDKPDIRFIIHYSHPGSIDAYYQEIGRGGRDGGRCDCILLFSRYDRKVQEQFIVNATPTADMVEDCFHEIVHGGGDSGKIALRRHAYEEHTIELFEMEKAGMLRRHSAMCATASIYLSREFDEALTACSPLQREILRAFDRHLSLSRKGCAVEVDLHEFRRRCFPDTDIFTLEQTLLHMEGSGIIAYRPAERTICYDVLGANIDDRMWREIDGSSRNRRTFKMSRLEMMLAYGSLRTCLRDYILDALGQSGPQSTCGFCDNCL